MDTCVTTFANELILIPTERRNETPHRLLPFKLDFSDGTFSEILFKWYSLISSSNRYSVFRKKKVYCCGLLYKPPLKYFIPLYYMYI